MALGVLFALPFFRSLYMYCFNSLFRSLFYVFSSFCVYVISVVHSLCSSFFSYLFHSFARYRFICLYCFFMHLVMYVCLS